MGSLFSLAEQIRKCTACPLWNKRTLAVPGEGPEKARLMFIGGAPGSEEDRLGQPFVGRAGEFLDEMLKKAGIERKDVFITESCKCHPPKNRNPTFSEIKTCRELWLDQQIDVITPSVIVVLGRIALRSLLGKSSIKEWHGKVVEKEKRKYFVTYHPAAGMRFPSIRKEMEKDFIELRRWRNDKA